MWSVCVTTCRAFCKTTWYSILNRSHASSTPHLHKPIRYRLAVPHGRRVTLLVCMLNLAPLAFGQTAVENATVTDEEFSLPLEKTTATLVDEAMAALGSPRFEDRHRATRRLIDFGAPAFAKLRAKYAETDDLEIRSRIETIVQAAYLDYHVYSNFGFLGIRNSNFSPGPDDFPQIPVGHSGIAIESVTVNSGAAHAGLMAQDVIIALDGAPIPGAGRKAFENFSAWIRERRPGATVSLTVMRDKEQLELQATLTRPPPDRETAGGVGVNKLEEMTKAAKANFKVWWVRYFRSNPSRTEGND